MKWPLLISASALTAAGIYANGLFQLKKQVKISTKVKLQKANLQEVVLVVLIAIHNPTTTAVRISPPQITLYHQNKELAVATVSPSQEKGGNYTIQPKAVTSLGEIEFKIPLSKLFTVASSILNLLTESGNTMTISTNVVTNLFIPPFFKTLVDTTEITTLSR